MMRSQRVDSTPTFRYRDLVMYDGQVAIVVGERFMAADGRESFPIVTFTSASCVEIRGFWVLANDLNLVTT